MRKIINPGNVIILSLLITLFVLRGIFINRSLIGHSIDWSVPTTPSLIREYLKSLLFTWRDFNLGEAQPLFLNLFPLSSLFYFLGFLGFSNVLITRLMIFVSIFLSIISFYLFLGLFLRHYGDRLGLEKDSINNTIVFFSALIYPLSPFLFNEIIFGSNVQFLTFALLPLFLYLFLRYLEEDKFYWLFLATIISIFVSASTQNLIFANLFFLFFSLIDKKPKKYFLFLGFCLLVNSFWIISFLVQWFSFSEIALGEDIRGPLEYLKINAPNIFKSIFGYEYFFNRNNYLSVMPNWFFYFWLFNKCIFFILPLFAGLFLVKKKLENPLVYFLILIFLIDIFFVKGGNSPLGRINIFFYENIPLFNIFRSQQHYQVIYVFFTALFFALSWLWIFNLKKNSWFRKILLVVIFFVLVIYSFPWLANGDIGTRILKEKKKDHLGLYQLSSGYQKLYHFIENQKIISRLLLLPMSYSPLYLSTEFQDANQGGDIDMIVLAPTLVADSNVQTKKMANLLWSGFIEQLDKRVLMRFLELSNFKFLALRRDILPLFNKYSTFYNYQPMKNFLRELDFLNLLFEEDYISLYEVSDKNYLPHFYIPQKIVVSNKKEESLFDLANFENFPIRTAVFHNREEKLLNKANEILVEGEIKNKINYLTSETDKQLLFRAEDIFFPYARWKPGHLLYPLILKKEQFDEWKARNNLEKLLEKKLFYASKRISEIEKWEREIDLNKVLNQYSAKIRKAIELLKRDEWRKQNLALSENIYKINSYLKAHQERLITKKFFNEDERKKIQEIFEEFEEEIKGLRARYISSQIIYSLEIPKDGDYQMFIKNENFNRYFKGNQLVLEFLNEKINIPFVAEREGWFTSRIFKLQKGEEKLKMEIPEAVNLLSDNNWQNDLKKSIFANRVLIDSNYLRFSFPERSSIFFNSIEDYKGEAFYKISFDYFSPSGERGITLIEDTGEDKGNVLFSETLSKTTQNSLNHIEKIFQSSSGVKKAEIFLWNKNKGDSDFQIFNFRVEKIFEPKIVLKNVQQEEFFSVPQIAFVKVNPTKYRIKVERAKEPYFLVFSEKFHRSWKAYIKNLPNTRDKGNYDFKIASYFNGEIEEGNHKEIFLERKIFETLGKKSIPEKRHFLVNGYANSWYITPEDAKNRENYEIIIEFSPQRYVYLGMGLSILVILGCLGYLIFGWQRKKGCKLVKK